MAGRIAGLYSPPLAECKMRISPLPLLVLLVLSCVVCGVRCTASSLTTRGRYESPCGEFVRLPARVRALLLLSRKCDVRGRSWSRSRRLQQLQHSHCVAALLCLAKSKTRNHLVRFCRNPAVDSMRPLFFRVLLLVLVLDPTEAYISGLRALFLPQRALAREEVVALDLELNWQCTAHTCTHTTFLRRFQPIVWLRNTVQPEPKTGLELLGASVGSETLVVNSKSGRKATIKTKKHRPSWHDNGFSAMEAGLF